MDLFVTLIVILLVIFATLIKRKYSYWKNLGITQFDVIFPYGNIKDVGKKHHMSKFLCDHYNKTKAVKKKFSGVYLFIRPVLMIVDLDIIKSVLVKDFKTFPNRGIYFNEKNDPVSAHMFSLEDDPWRQLRQKLSPTFTSGKLKMMFSTIDDVSEKLLKVIDKESEHVTVEIKDILARFTTDVIGSAAFGLECDSLENRHSKFYEMGTRIFAAPSNLFARFMRSTYREIARKLRMKSLPQDIAEFYMSITRETVTYREENPHLKRNDFMNLLVEMKRDKIITVEQIAAQSFIFFLAGYETSSSTMTYCMFELALNQDIQEKARESVLKVLDRHNNEFTYDAISEMSYLEQCINETLRKYPVVTNLQRTAVKDFKIPSINHEISKNHPIWIPVYAIHHDKELYPDPETFDPDRFSTDEVMKRHSMAFLPFGEGPRICIGMRFGMLEAKLGLAKILKNYKFTLDKSRTPLPLKISPGNIVLTPHDKIYLQMSRI